MSNPAQLDYLRTQIGLKQSALLEEQMRLTTLRKEIDVFARQYERALGSLEARLDAVSEQLERFRAPTDNLANLGMWGPYGSFEESFDAKYRRPQNTPIEPYRGKRAADDKALRSLYRKLVRRFHPDTTQNAEDKLRFTVIMAQINAAYRAKDADALYALEGQKTHAAPDLSRMDNIVTMVDLVKLAGQLDAQLTDIRIEYQNLLSGPLMQLKIESSIARSRGRDLLREIAERVRAEIKSAEAELIRLRGY